MPEELGKPAARGPGPPGRGRPARRPPGRPGGAPPGSPGRPPRGGGGSWASEAFGEITAAPSITLVSAVNRVFRDIVFLLRYSLLFPIGGWQHWRRRPYGPRGGSREAIRY